jgi:ferredoxin
MRVSVSIEKCVSAGQCVMAAFEVFDQDDIDGRVVLLTEEPDESLHAAVKDAVAMCPAHAITIEESS